MEYGQNIQWFPDVYKRQDESGALPEEATVDGIHLKKDYCLKWTDYIRTHTVPG